MLLASFYRLEQVDLGFRVDNVLTFEVNLPSVRYDASDAPLFHEELDRRLQAIPGVVAAGGISFLPATGSYHGWTTSILSGPRAGTSVATRDGFNIQHRTVSGDLFEALDIPLVAGRMFDARENDDAPARAIVSSQLCRCRVPGNAVRQRRSASGLRSGTARRSRSSASSEIPRLMCMGTSSLVVYHPHRQFANNRNWALSQVVAAGVPPEQILADVRATVSAMDPELVVYRAAPMTEVVGRGTRREQFALVLMAAFASVAVLLATVGLYGVLAYTVRQRTQEIGVRIALGATAAHIRLAVFRQAGLVLGAGLRGRTFGALLLGRWLATLTFGISPSDPRIVLAAAVVLTTTGLLAAWLPSRRAARIEPKYAMQEG